MVGEISPDGKFVWNGTEWLPREDDAPVEENVIESTKNVFEMGGQELEGDIGWEPVTEKSDEGGKGKLIAMSVVGLLILSVLSWVMYAFVIDPMLFPDPYSKTKFVSVVGDQPTIDEVISGDSGPWNCHVEMEMEEEGMAIRTNFDMYASKDAARSYSKLSAGIFGSMSKDIWIDENHIAWKSDDQETVEKGIIAISSLDSSPADEILSNSSGPVELCFIHHAIVESMDADPSQKFTSDKERFPDEDGVRAVKVETKMVLDEEDGEMNIAVYFDGDDNLLGTKIYNSSFDCLVTIDYKSFSKPGWVTSADSETPMLLSVDYNNIWSAQHNALVNTQFNATYLMDDAKVVIYEADWDDDGNSIHTISYEVTIQDAMDEGALIQPTNWNNDPVNCTLNYTDTDADGMISSGDIVSVDCEEDVLNGYQLGLANANGVAETVNMDMPWLPSIFTIIALLGAAMLVSRRD